MSAWRRRGGEKQFRCVARHIFFCSLRQAHVAGMDIWRLAITADSWVSTIFHKRAVYTRCMWRVFCVQREESKATKVQLIDSVNLVLLCNVLHDLQHCFGGDGVRKKKYDNGPGGQLRTGSSGMFLNLKKGGLFLTDSVLHNLINKTRKTVGKPYTIDYIHRKYFVSPGSPSSMIGGSGCGGARG
ncbi:unnamed protein product, partial [Pylaiella littoralis]